MINEIKIDNVATFINPISIKPLMVNYFYGGNGSGKTTLAKLIANPKIYSDCCVKWDNNTELQTLVYNRDFVEENFAQNTKLKGIFTLGKDAKNAQKFMDDTYMKIENERKELDKLAKSLDKFDAQKNNEKLRLVETCWTVKKKYENIFKQSFQGFIGSKEAFTKKCLAEMINTASLLSENDLKKKYIDIVSCTITEYTPITELNIHDLKNNEDCDLLFQSITGKDDSQISHLINRIGNSDWIKKGLEYAEVSDGKCPFCQKVLETALINEIKDYFDETYDLRCKTIKNFKANYESYFSTLLKQLKSIPFENYPLLTSEELNTIIKEIEILYADNIKLLASKIEYPSNSITISLLQNYFISVQNKINDFNKIIKDNNAIYKNLSVERKTIVLQMWKFVCSELDNALKQYVRIITEVNKGEDRIKSLITQRNSNLKGWLDAIKLKEVEITSVKHTINEINTILDKFGFTGFSLMKTDSGNNYKIIRKDGSDAKETLSEGEYTFISFLYFYQLIKGSTETTGTLKDKVIVIDDPVSSLDSNILFIISTLVKSLISDCLSVGNSVKQIFVLTHNVYFHKEITFHGSRKNPSVTKEVYWVIQKRNNESSIKFYTVNPIKTSYELLWHELENLSNSSRVTIFNTLRRILEYYFNIVGGINYEKCIEKFEGEDKLLCKSLISSINDGSHFISDDFVMCNESESTENYLRVFKLIFENMGHISHYKMMMKETA